MLCGSGDAARLVIQARGFALPSVDVTDLEYRLQESRYSYGERFFALAAAAVDDDFITGADCNFRRVAALLVPYLVEVMDVDDSAPEAELLVAHD